MSGDVGVRTQRTLPDRFGKARSYSISLMEPYSWLWIEFEGLPAISAGRADRSSLRAPGAPLKGFGA
jgi:hypothetical protein